LTHALRNPDPQPRTTGYNNVLVNAYVGKRTDIILDKPAALIPQI